MAAPATLFDLQFPLLTPAVRQRKPALVPPPPALIPGEREEVRRLRESLAAASGTTRVTSGAELVRALARRSRDEMLATTLEPFDALLGGGLPRGRMIELVAGRRASGRYSIVLAALAAATSAGEAAALVDLGDHFDPQLAAANGVDLQRTLWIRPRTLKQAVMAVEMIAATGFQLVVLDAAAHPMPGPRIPVAAWVRLARSAEAHGNALLIATPYAITGTAGEAQVTARSARARWIGGGRSPSLLAGTEVKLQLEKHRHLRPGRSATLTLITWEHAVAVDAR
jgi:hypothetical protein